MEMLTPKQIVAELDKYIIGQDNLVVYDKILCKKYSSINKIIQAYIF